MTNNLYYVGGARHLSDLLGCCCRCRVCRRKYSADVGGVGLMSFCLSCGDIVGGVLTSKVWYRCRRCRTNFGVARLMMEVSC